MNWPKAVSCLPEGSGIGVAEALLSEDWEAGLDSLAREHGAELVTCALREFLNLRSSGIAEQRARLKLEGVTFR